ncbi:MAG TPA: RIP metalloprotease RseP, partial [Xanthomonadaceae bacterium]|nr:RIP metalloprotease RseP [Xanthomonadaceae bacterium]
CFMLFWAMFMIGLPDYQPIVGRADGLAAQAGFVAGDRLRSVAGEPVANWTDAAMLLSDAAMHRKAVRVDVSRDDGGDAVRILPMQQLASGLDESEALGQIGLVPKQFMLPAVVGEVESYGPVGQLQSGDRILAVDGVAVSTFDDLVSQTHAHARIGEPLRLDIQRAQAHLRIEVQPKQHVDPGTGKSRLMIGIGPQVQNAVFDGQRQYGPIAALGASAQEMVRQCRSRFHLLMQMIEHGDTQNLSGPIGIARYANQSAQQGVAWFLFFLAILSLGLGITNLLPVPILDGGHLLYYLIELVKGSPVSERSQAVGQYVGIAVLGGLMCLAFYNDLLRPLS